MKITFRYEESDDRDLHMTLRMTLTKKYAEGPARDVVKLFVEHYNKKHTENPLDASALHLKVVGGNHLDNSVRLDDFMASGDECYVVGGEIIAGASPPAKRVATAQGGAGVACSPVASPATCTPASGAGAKAEKGKARCKRFGCNKYFDPDGPPQECVHHKSPPIFHETAKWWSCCPDRKAYDWEEFMRIPGCQKSTCSTQPEGQDGKRFLGGTDLRNEHAPVRLDADAPLDPRKKLDACRKGLEAVGVDGVLFEKVWGKLAVETGGDFEKVCERFRNMFSGVLEPAAA